MSIWKTLSTVYETGSFITFMVCFPTNSTMFWPRPFWLSSISALLFGLTLMYVYTFPPLPSFSFSDCDVILYFSMYLFLVGLVFVD